MKKPLLEALKDRPLLGDGAMGTQLMIAGLEQGNCGELWNLTQPQKVLGIQQRVERPRRADSPPVRLTSLSAIHAPRTDGSPSRTPMPSGPLVSYTRSGGSPSERAISRMGTRIPREPSRYTLVEFGKASP